MQVAKHLKSPDEHARAVSSPMPLNPRGMHSARAQDENVENDVVWQDHGSRAQRSLPYDDQNKSRVFACGHCRLMWTLCLSALMLAAVAVRCCTLRRRTLLLLAARRFARRIQPPPPANHRKRVSSPTCLTDDFENVPPLSDFTPHSFK